MEGTPVTRRLLLLLVPLAAAIGCAQPMPDRQPLALDPIAVTGGQQRVTDHVMVITDASLTMYKANTFPEAKALTRAFLAGMPEAGAPARNPGRYEVGLIGFGGRERVTSPLAPLDRGALAAEANALEILGKLTPLHTVLNETTLSLEGKSGRAAVVVFSDGLPDSEEQAMASAQNLVDSYGGPVCFHTVQTGTQPEGTRFLQRLASLTSCGSARNGSAVNSSGAAGDLVSSVFLGPAPLPAVAAGPPCSERIVLRDIHFEFDSDQISGEGSERLDSAIAEMNACPDLPFRIEGHTDSMGPEQYNEGLSMRRAESVQRYVIRGGIDTQRLDTQGLGESRPLADNDTREGRAQNRRVALVPVP